MPVGSALSARSPVYEVEIRAAFPPNEPLTRGWQLVVSGAAQLPLFFWPGQLVTAATPRERRGGGTRL